MPASFIDIMMLRPAVRTSVMPACNFGSSTSTTPPHLAPLLSQAMPRSPMSAPSRFSRRKFSSVVLGEFDKQDRLGIAAQERIDGRLEHRDVAGKAEHGAIDQFDRDRPELDDVLRRRHRFVEAAEMAGADRAAAEQRREFQFDLGRECERALGADQKMREIDVVAAGDQRIEIVAADAALHFRKPPFDLAGLARGDGEKIAHQSLRHIDPGVADAGRNARACRRRERRRSTARSRAYCHSAASARRRNCCRPCRRWWRATPSRCRPETTGRTVSACD